MGDTLKDSSEKQAMKLSHSDAISVVGCRLSVIS